MEWTEPQRKELYYHVNRISRVQTQYGIGVRDPKEVCLGLKEMFAQYDGDSVVKAVKKLIQDKGRVPLPSEIERFLDEQAPD
jgi:hypothetical protein